MAVRTINNQYPGINAHLHSYFQSEGGWPEFHTLYLADVMRQLRVQLLPMGYTVGLEQSLQLRRNGEPISKPRSDISIYDPDPIRAGKSSLPHLQSGEAVALMDFVAEKEDQPEYRAVAIYEVDAGRRGETVAWIELLSPSNKPGGQDFTHYEQKRRRLLWSGIVFVELDFLHETPTTFEKMPSYDPDEPESEGTPYRIVVLDPRPSMRHGWAYPYGFCVDEALPIVTIPLHGEDRLDADFGAAYQKTIAETLYGIEYVDYEQLPLNFERYRADDRARIVARMLAILRAARDGTDLEGAPLPVESIDLESGLEALKALRAEENE